MFATVRQQVPTIFANFNSKTGLFTIDHKQQNAEGTFREHKTTTGRIKYVEEHKDLVNVLIKRVMVKEEPNFEDKSKMDKKIMISARMSNGTDAVVTYSMGYFASRVLTLLRGADLSQPISLHGGCFPEGSEKTMKDGSKVVRDKPEPILYAQQNGENVKASYSDDPEFKVPAIDWVEVKNGKGVVINKVADTSNRDDYVLELAKDVAARVETAKAVQPSVAPAAMPAAAPAPQDADESDDAVLSAADVLGDGGDSDAEQFRS